MFEQIITFITPGPLTERFNFRARVFMSWISLGLVLGLIFGIAGLSSGAATAGGALALFVQSLLSFPIVLCFFGLIGLGIDSMRGRNAEYHGWYWWLFPIVTYIVIGFWLTFAILGFTLALGGVRLPDLPRTDRQPRKRRNPNERAVDDWLKKNATQTGEQFVKENPKFRPQNQQEEAVYQEIVQNSQKTLEESISEMSEEEFEAFIEMLLRMLGFTFLS